MNASKKVVGRDLTAEDIVNRVFVSEVALDRAGVLGAFTLSRTPGPPTDVRREDLWTVDRDEVRWRFGWERSVSSPAFSPDGELLIFLSADSDGVSQVFAAPSAGDGPPRGLTQFGAPVEAYAWSPDGRWIAFTALSPAEFARQQRGEETGHNWQIPETKANLLRLWVLNVATGEYHQVFEELLGVGELAWMPDSSAIFFQGVQVQTEDALDVMSQIFLVAWSGEGPATPQRLTIWLPQDEGRATLRSGHLGTFTPDPTGCDLAFLSAAWLQAPTSGNLFVVNIEEALSPGGALASFRTDDADFTVTNSLAWVDETTLLFLAWKGLTCKLFLVESEDRRSWQNWVELSTPEDLCTQSFALEPKSQELLLVAGAPDHEAELYRTSLQQLRPKQPLPPKRLTWNNPWLREVNIPPKKPISWPSDGYKIQGLLILPPDHQPGTRLPLLLAPHGGPMSVWSLGWIDKCEYPVSMLAQRGYAILLPNYRGSTGRGSAFAASIERNVGIYDIEDLLAGVKFLVDQGIVDESRVGILGHSYGGYLANWAATAHSQQFRAAVGMSGITHWMSFIGTTDIATSFSRELWGGWWFRQGDAELYWQRSPLAYVTNRHTAFLMVHGEADDRVPTEQSQELFTSLYPIRAAKEPLELVLYPGEPHSISQKAHQLDLIRRILDWFEKNLPIVTD